ncbi:MULTISPECIES: TetR/AcrR family transcriptional regulator [Ramlibacter]|uniref:TetR family transcriptional regulator n=1 Tax=Ramlibacter aquaticus TaxID=2780094 RepID=A0ABR9SEA1_9BURK|nr:MULTISPECIES: TetR/AcrR family transcriptional regulator [Ramlibacter]MBE7940688.1 TetR family transcriptional regulator [Ramlibacter aquaticus]
MDMMTAPAPAKRPRGRPRKTAEEASDGNRRDELIRSAARLFRRRGFEATRTRDIAEAVGMRSGSPFYHFETKQALLFAVMEEGMKRAVARQQQALDAVAGQPPLAQLRQLIRQHFEVLLGPGNDFIPVMLYESRAITPRQRATLARLQGDYEALWLPVLAALHQAGRLHGELKLARLLIFGALNWSVQWYDRRKGASLDALADAALALFTGSSE